MRIIYGIGKNFILNVIRAETERLKINNPLQIAVGILLCNLPSFFNYSFYKINIHTAVQYINNILDIFWLLWKFVINK